MALPSRTYVGVTLFGLIASLMVVPYTLLVLSEYEPPPDAPHEVLFPPDSRHDGGDKAFLGLASLFSLLLLAYGWRSLLQGARRDMALRKELERRAAAPGEAQGKRPPAPPPPPGYQ